MPAVWQLQSPNTKIAEDAVDARSLAKRYLGGNCGSMYVTYVGNPTITF
jgi:hypothetical protein